MVGSAAYSSLTGSTPAVVSPEIYNIELPRAGVDAVTISDSLSSGAIKSVTSPARRAINAGLDLLLYGQGDPAGTTAYGQLLTDEQHGVLSRTRVAVAAAKIAALKRNLNLE